MKTQLKILMAILMITPITASAGDKTNTRLKKQCQYIVYGNGENDPFDDTYLFGIIEGIVFMIPSDERSDYARVKKTIIREKACKEALNNISKHGFQGDFKIQALKVLMK